MLEAQTRWRTINDEERVVKKKNSEEETKPGAPGRKPSSLAELSNFQHDANLLTIVKRAGVGQEDAWAFVRAGNSLINPYSLPGLTSGT